MCQELSTGKVCLSACWDTTPREQAPPRTRPTPPGTRHPPGAGTPRPRSRHPPNQASPTPWDQATPQQSMLGDTVNERAVRILLECNLVSKSVEHGNSVDYVALHGEFWLHQKLSKWRRWSDFCFQGICCTEMHATVHILRLVHWNANCINMVPSFLKKVHLWHNNEYQTNIAWLMFGNENPSVLIT